MKIVNIVAIAGAPEATTFEKSQKGYSCLAKATSAHCDQKPQHLRNHREAIHGWSRPYQFIVISGTTFEKSQRGYSWLVKAALVHCGQRPQHLRKDTEVTCGWPHQFIVTRGHNICPITERLFVAGHHHSSLWTKATTMLQPTLMTSLKYFVPLNDTLKIMTY